MAALKLSTLCQDILLDLATAPKRRKSPWRTPTIATITPDGAPEARVVVLRRATNAILELHTDIRSSKWASLTSTPQLAWTFWDKGKQVQLRVTGAATLHTSDETAEEVWGRLSEGTRRVYGVSPGPGNALNSPGGYTFETECQANFGVIQCQMHTMDWLHLARTGHRRTIFRRSEDVWEGRFVAP